MAGTKISLRDFLLGWIISDPTAGKTGSVGVLGTTPVDSTGVEYNAANPMPVSAANIATVDATNSSAVALAGGAAFTGVAKSITTYGSVTVSVFADQASATNGLSVQQSSNGTNWDFTDTFTVSASAGKTVTIPRQGAFLRVVYTNGATPNTVFRLQTILNAPMPAPSAVKPVDGTTFENDFQETLSVNMLSNGTTGDLQRSIQGAANTGLGTTATAPTKLSGTGLTKATVNITTITTTEIVALTAGQTIRVYKIMLNFALAQTINFTSNSVSLNGAAMTFAANSGLVLDFDGEPWLVGTVAQNLAIVTSTVGAVTGVIYYRKEV